MKNEIKAIEPVSSVTMRLVKSEDLNHHGTLLPEEQPNGLLNPDLLLPPKF